MENCLFGVQYKPKKLSEIFEDYDDFQDNFRTSAFGYIFPAVLPAGERDYLPIVWALINARYGASHITSQDENQWVDRLFATIYQYGPTFVKVMDIQEKLRSLTETDIITGNKTIYDRAYNPSTVVEGAPNNDFGELDTVNEQTKSKDVKSKLEGYSILTNLLETDLCEDFLTKFRKLFRVVLVPKYFDEESGI